MAVFTDSFDPIPDKINDVINTSKKYDILYNYFADKWNIGDFTFQPELDIKLFIYELVDKTNPRISPTFRRIDFIKHAFVDKVASIGQENSKIISRHLKTANNFFKLSEAKNIESLSNIDGIGIIQIMSIKKFFLNKTNLKVLSELEKKLKIIKIHPQLRKIEELRVRR